MAITAASFIPEERKGGGGGGGGGGGASGAPGGPAAHGMNANANTATSAAQSTGPAESQPANHPVSGTAIPSTTGAGQDTIHKGGRGGK